MFPLCRVPWIIACLSGLLRRRVTIARPVALNPSHASVTATACVVLLVAALSHVTALAQYETQPGQPNLKDPALALDANSQLVWNREWSLYASRYVMVGDDYFACAKYMPGYPSSSYVTPQALVQRNTSTRTIRIAGNMSRDIKIAPSLSDAQAAAPALPSLDSGEYGHVDSVEIVQITGPQEMIVRRIWLIDEDKLKDQIDKLQDKARQRSERQGNSRSDANDEIESNFQFRMQLVDHQRKQRDFRSQPVLLMGYDASRLKADERWHGPTGEGLDIAITGPRTIAYTRSNSGRPRDLEVVVALPVDLFKGRLTRVEFMAMLATRNLTLQQFIDISLEEKKNDHDQVVYNTIKRVEDNRPVKDTAVADNNTADNDAGTDKPLSARARRLKDRKAAKAKAAAEAEVEAADGKSSANQPENDKDQED